MEEGERELTGILWDETGADMAEWFPLKDPREPVESGDIVELLDGTISRNVSNTGQLFVVATRPMLVGNRPQPGVPSAQPECEGRAVVLIGQAPVKVSVSPRVDAHLPRSPYLLSHPPELTLRSLPTQVAGRCGSNETLVPSGRNDGTCVAAKDNSDQTCACKITTLHPSTASEASERGDADADGHAAYHLVKCFVTANVGARWGGAGAPLARPQCTFPSFFTHAHVSDGGAHGDADADADGDAAKQSRGGSSTSAASPTEGPLHNPRRAWMRMSVCGAIVVGTVIVFVTNVLYRLSVLEARISSLGT